MTPLYVFLYNTLYAIAHGWYKTGAVLMYRAYMLMHVLGSGKGRDNG